MKIATGTVVHGKIIVEGQSFVEGEQVTILGHDNGETFQVSPEEKRLLLQSIAQADRGEFVDADELLTELDESN
jgi:redox-sensitive bicupin YhaK (pirin superfamily)